MFKVFFSASIIFISVSASAIELELGKFHTITNAESLNLSHAVSNAKYACLKAAHVDEVGDIVLIFESYYSEGDMLDAADIILPASQEFTVTV